MKILIAAGIALLFVMGGFFIFNISFETIVTIFVIFLCIALILFFVFKGDVSNERESLRINKTGELRKATVLSIQQTNKWLNSYPEVRIRMRVEGLSQEVCIKEYIPTNDLSVYQPQSVVEVVQDRDNLEKIVLKSRFFDQLQEKHRKDMAKKQAKQEKKMAGQVK